MEDNNLVKVQRGNHMESCHQINVAVVNADGELLHQVGNTQEKIYARSSMKPFQAIPIVETGAADYYHFSDADLSLCTASHNGETMHTDRVLSILDKVGLDDTYLGCGTHIPRWRDTYKNLILNGEEVTPLYNNCSGKHTGMLATVKYMGESTENYYEIDHPIQQRIRKVISEMCSYPSDEIVIGIDGCGVPVHALPLDRLAHGYAKMVNPKSLREERRTSVERITTAMTTAPEMVGGTNRFCTDFMLAGKGRFIGKAGAEGVYCIGDKETGLGIAVKVVDGNGRAVYPAAMEVLIQLGLLSDDQIENLKEYHHPKLFNARNEVIGELIPSFNLKNALAF
ncbi:asparaginase [Virgibacillus ndiopensis]|uniref:asparaginase n=1 Tax=Virgibacillus ndiopensis TaxID=2004408 RepID=UPI001FEB66B5|nr:asparaginase [Virgibacillus ndiopensis]